MQKANCVTPTVLLRKQLYKVMKEKYQVSGFTMNKEAIYVNRNRIFVPTEYDRFKAGVPKIEDLRKQIDLMSDQLCRKDDQISQLNEVHKNKPYIFRA